jgi:hypothetical protein
LPAGSTIDVFIVRDQPSPPLQFQSNNIAALLSHIDSEPFDGATNLAANDLLPTISPHSNTRYEWRALFSDGFSTLGRALPKHFGSAPIHTFTGNATADHDTLKAFSQRTGGKFYVCLVCVVQFSQHYHRSIFQFNVVIGCID